MSISNWASCVSMTQGTFLFVSFSRGTPALVKSCTELVRVCVEFFSSWTSLNILKRLAVYFCCCLFFFPPQHPFFRLHSEHNFLLLWCFWRRHTNHGFCFATLHRLSKYSNNQLRLKSHTKDMKTAPKYSGTTYSPASDIESTFRDCRAQLDLNLVICLKTSYSLLPGYPALPRE